MSASVNRDVAKKLEDFRQKVATTAEKVVFVSFPNKILELTELIESTASAESIFHTSNAYKHTDTTIYSPPQDLNASEEANAKKRKRAADEAGGFTCIHEAKYTAVVHANKHITKLHEIVKSEADALIDLCDKVKLWVNLTMPKIEDGDNFGVQVQEEVLGELHRSQESAYNLRDITRQHNLARAKICSKLIKYPNVEDYALSLMEHDEKEQFMARQRLVDVRNIYAVLTDLVHKNIAKIRVPKANNGVALY